MLLGMLVSLIGEGVLSQITSRAAAAFNLQVAQRASNGSAELLVLDGMTEQDLLRLGEEGIDSIHALALASTGRAVLHHALHAAAAVRLAGCGAAHRLCRSGQGADVASG